MTRRKQTRRSDRRQRRPARHCRRAPVRLRRRRQAGRERHDPLSQPISLGSRHRHEL